MAYDLDVANPDDDDTVSGYPSNARDFRVAVSGLLGEEHSNTEGVHKFGRGTKAQRNAISTWVIGSIWFRTDRISGQVVIDICNTAGGGDGNWDETAFGILDFENNWTALQIATYQAMTITPGTPDSVAVDWDNGNYQKVTLVGDSTLAVSTNKPASGSGTQMVVEVTQGGAGSFTLAYSGTEYKFARGVEPVLSTGVGEIDILQLTLRSDQNIHVGIAQDSS